MDGGAMCDVVNTCKLSLQREVKIYGYLLKLDHN